ncbi:MAG: hypothetical protein KDA79_10770 [Planctomycetaceae bacterium]|nr:hypothetical protein [Planctomycetaceae bacterium]
MGEKLIGIATAVLKALLSPFLWIWQLCRGWFQGRLSRRANILLEAITVTLVVGGLAWLNWSLHLERYLTGPWVLRRVWLGVLALCVYGTIRLTVLMFRQLPRKTGEFRDIREAITAGWHAAMDVRINLQDSPLFLVVGADSVVEESMRTSTFIGDRLVVNDPRLPAHWFGDSEAIWLTIPGISAVAEQAVRERDSRASAGRRAKNPEAVRLTAAEQERAWQRMSCLVRMLRQLRRPVVPVNGVILLIPFQWMQDPSLAQLAETVKLDMEVLQSQLGVKCTCLVVFHGIELAEEFNAYAQSMPEAGRQRRCGCTLPAFSEHTPQDSLKMHEWLCQFFRQQVYRFYMANRESAGNPQLYRLVQGLHAAGDGLTRLLNHAFPPDVQERMYLGGVYFTELSRKGRTFFDGVAAKLSADHDESIGWNNQELGRDRWLRRMASLAAGGVVALLTVDAFLIGRAFLSW